MEGRSSGRSLGPLLAAVILLLLASRLQAATFFDDFSTVKAWGEVVVVGTGSFSVNYPATGGPSNGPYRETTFSFTSPGVYYLAHVAFFSGYSPPAQGSIASIDFSFDGNDLNPAQGQIAYHLLIYQNGTYYQGPVHFLFANSWTPFSDFALTAVSFTMVGSGPGPTHPDFSATGSAMQFGTITAASSTANNGNTVTTTSGIANWSVTINPGYFTVVPCRLLDTRAAGQGPALTAGLAQIVPVTGHCGVPAEAIAVVFNVTVVQPTADAQLTVYAANLPAPVSTLPVMAGITRSNIAIVMPATNGQGTVAVLLDVGTTNVILDVAGYFQ
jgi:hypothetical protein